MLHFSKFKSAVIWVICALGVLLSIPNFVKPENIPDWVPLNRFTLGLDLQGGAYLLLEVDTETLVRERMEQATDGVRQALREENIGFRDIKVAGDALSFTLRDAAQEAKAVKALLPVVRGPNPAAPEFAQTVNAGSFDLKLTPEALRAAQLRAVQQSVEIVRRRIDETGVNEPVVAQQGANRILVQLPGLDDPTRIKRLLGQTAKMTFHLLGEQGQPGVRMLPSQDNAYGDARIPVKTKVEVDGARLRDAQATMDSRGGQWVVSFSFDSVGAKRFADITTKNVNQPFAIVLDGKVISAPVIREPITGGSGQISGNFSAQSANDLAVLLRAGALPAPLTVVEERTVGPDLGADAIQAGLIACLVGVVLVLGFMAVSYGTFGIFANIALIFNLALTIAGMSLLNATLTLPGIAGILLTLGMSVDANILINERIREETRKGSTPLAAMEAGFKRAFSTIVDSNLTTLIKMLLLYAVGTGTVKGFAVTISLGIITSMFTATLVARWMMAAWYKRKKPVTGLPDGFFHWWPGKSTIPFMKGMRAGLIGSVVLSAVSVVLFFTPGLNYGVDFAGGTVMEIRTTEKPDFGKLRGGLEDLNLGQVQLQEFGMPTDVLIRFETQPGGDQAQMAAVKKVQEKVIEMYPGTSIRRVESVGAAVSGELFDQGMMALGLAAIAMLIYITIRFEWQFGVGAVITMFLDVTKTVGFFAITGMQFNLTAIAAILTIMGYSINDKVVVYDRVRENLRLYRKMPLRELIDLSINETMSRTISTSMAMFLATLPLALFGGEALQEFAWVLLFGVVLASSSSIFIAAPILLLLGEHRLRRNPEEEEDIGFKPSEDREEPAK